MTEMFTIDFNQLEEDVRAFGLDVYSVDYGKLDWPAERIEEARLALIREQYKALGLTGDTLEEFCQQQMTWSQMNTGRIFNFWHFCYALMDSKMITTENYHYGDCIIKRGMVDPTELEDGIKLVLQPSVVKAGMYSAPIIDIILDFYKVEEMMIWIKVGR